MIIRIDQLVNPPKYANAIWGWEPDPIWQNDMTVEVMPAPEPDLPPEISVMFSLEPCPDYLGVILSPATCLWEPPGEDMGSMIEGLIPYNPPCGTLTLSPSRRECETLATPIDPPTVAVHEPATLLLVLIGIAVLRRRIQ